MRADRLIAALLVLQSRGRVTATELADELEVSLATARRDLEALSAAGVPVYPQPGRGGGWSLVGGARTDLSGLTAHEARALFLLVGPAASASDEARAALRKLVQALPSAFRTDAEAAADATVIDPTRWGEQPRHRPALVDLLEDAVVRRRRVRMTYTTASRQRSERVVNPWGLVAKGDTWYLVAGTDRGPRTFRIDRIGEAASTDEQATPRPAGFALDSAWDDVVGVVERKRARTQATIRIETRFLPVLRDRFGRQCEIVGGDAGKEADGWTRARVAAPTPLDLARNLAGWGGLVQVLGQPEVERLLLQLATELTELYRDRALPRRGRTLSPMTN